jgi:hypothetical protein
MGEPQDTDEPSLQSTAPKNYFQERAAHMPIPRMFSSRAIASRKILNQKWYVRVVKRALHDISDALYKRY